MKAFSIVRILFLWIFLLTTCALAGDDLVVMSIKGKVEYKKGAKGKFLPLTVGVALTKNDVVKTSFSSYAKLMYKQRQLLSIDENTTMKIGTLIATISGSDSEQSSTTGKIMSYLADKLSKSQSKSDKKNVYGAVRGGEELFNVVFPRKGFVMTTRPVFEWLNAGEPSTYMFTLLDENLSTVLEKNVNVTQLIYSDNDPALQYGKKYLWRVVRKSDGAESDIVSFTIMEPDTSKLVYAELVSLSDELKKMNADEIIFHIIKGTYYEQRELYFEAFNEYKRAINLAPEVKEYREMANYLLLRMGLYNEQQLLLK